MAKDVRVNRRRLANGSIPVIRRRDFVALLAALAVWPTAARAQVVRRPKIGVVYPGPLAMAGPRVDSLLKGLREFGFASSEQVEVVLRATEGDPSQIGPLVSEILSHNVDVI